MPQEYFYNGHLRWTFFWDNPNCWAAFLACLLAWLWWGQQKVAQARLPVQKHSPTSSTNENVHATLGEYLGHGVSELDLSALKREDAKGIHLPICLLSMAEFF